MSPPQPFRRPTLVLERLPEPPYEPDSVVDAPLIGFDAFSIDQRIFGWVRLSADRLTDLLNDHEEIAIDNAQVEQLTHPGVAWIDGMVLKRRQLIAVRAAGPHGDPARRQRSRLYPLAVCAGSFRMGGYLHARPGVAPLVEIRSRPTMIPLSSAWLEHWAEGRRVSQWVGTILFNRDRAESIEVVEDDAHQVDP
ncbi:MAG TPA: hypothetical protein VE640_00245 [Candidatus Bathyarchaeia archaeon]|nr:hypothetical protein [Candidatus Bathyarchaeia archaeon]